MAKFERAYIVDVAINLSLVKQDLFIGTFKFPYR